VNILGKTFSKLSYEEKRQNIKKNGTPTPELRELKQKKGTKIIRTFQTARYSKEWLCGCTTTKVCVAYKPRLKGRGRLCLPNL
jgi:hypothetical protein